MISIHRSIMAGHCIFFSFKYSKHILVPDFRNLSHCTFISGKK